MEYSVKIKSVTGGADLNISSCWIEEHRVEGRFFINIPKSGIKYAFVRNNCHNCPCYTSSGFCSHHPCGWRLFLPTRTDICVSKCPYARMVIKGSKPKIKW